MNQCKNCKAPDGERIFRHKDGFAWTQDWKKLSEWSPGHPSEWSNTATMIRIHLDTGLCDKCHYKAKHGWPVKP